MNNTLIKILRFFRLTKRLTSEEQSTWDVLSYKPSKPDIVDWDVNGMYPNSINPIAGQVRFDANSNKFEVYTGTEWLEMTASGSNANLL